MVSAPCPKEEKIELHQVITTNREKEDQNIVENQWTKKIKLTKESWEGNEAFSKRLGKISERR